MTEMHRIEFEIDEVRRSALEGEATRLGLEVPDVVSRALAAWLTDMEESAVVLKPAE
ncbi:MAG: hypothetical protein HGB10_01075 [Coriobacteriia bacterium]|nr:hypothetical protein [Coriobacteriia bacterium]